MEAKAGASLMAYFGEMSDPRMARTRLHKLEDLLVIAICGVICGADDWVGIEQFGESKRGWFEQFLELPNGIPSHDTFGRVFSRLNPEAFQACFLGWVQAVFEVTEGQVIAVDGKQLCGSYDHTNGKAAIRMVSAWATSNQLVLGQVKVGAKSNEIPAIPALLRLLDISGCIVTVDAMGCQKAIAHQIVAGGADYVLAVKGNQGNLFEELTDLFAHATAVEFEAVISDQHQSQRHNHGRLERRQCHTIADPLYLSYLRDRDQWSGLQTLVRVVCERTIAAVTTSETRYFISSLPVKAPALLRAVRSHWGIENNLHWVLDVAFREDDCRVRKDHAPHNLAILRHIALNLLKQERSLSVGMKNKRLRAGWDHRYLLKVLLN